MAKKTYAEVKESLGTLKDEAKQAKKDLKNFCKDQKLDPEAEHTGNKKWVKLKALVDKSAKQVTEAEAWLAENKKDKEKDSKPRATKYEYPAEVQTAADKKKWRAKARAEAKRAEKGEKADKGEKSSKKKDKGGDKEAKSDKGEKSGKKKNKDKAPKEEKVAAED